MKWSQKITADIRDSFSARLVKLGFTCPGLHFWEEKIFGEKNNNSQWISNFEEKLFGREFKIAHCVSKESPERNELSWKSSFVANFGVSAMNFWTFDKKFRQVVRSPEYLFRVVFEELFLGRIIVEPLYLGMQQKNSIFRSIS